MKFAIIFESLLLLFHSSNSFQIVNGNEEYIPTVTGGSVTINANADYWFQTCRLMKNGHEICQVTLSTWIPYSSKMTCASNYMDVIYNGSGSSFICKFEVPNLQNSGNNHGSLHCTSTC